MAKHLASLPLSTLVWWKGKMSHSMINRWSLYWVRLVIWADNLSLCIHFRNDWKLFHWERSLDEELVGDAGWCLPLTTRHPFSNPGCHNNQIALLVPHTTGSFMVMIIISQFTLQAEIWFTFPKVSHHMTCKMSERE